MALVGFPKVGNRVCNVSVCIVTSCCGSYVRKDKCVPSTVAANKPQDSTEILQ
jgi:hypothetical protein